MKIRIYPVWEEVRKRLELPAQIELEYFWNDNPAQAALMEANLYLQFCEMMGSIIWTSEGYRWLYNPVFQKGRRGLFYSVLAGEDLDETKAFIHKNANFIAPARATEDPYVDYYLAFLTEHPEWMEEEDQHVRYDKVDGEIKFLMSTPCAKAFAEWAVEKDLSSNVPGAKAFIQRLEAVLATRRR